MVSLSRSCWRRCRLCFPCLFPNSSRAPALAWVIRAQTELLPSTKQSNLSPQQLFFSGTWSNFQRGLKRYFLKRALHTLISLLHQKEHLLYSHRPSLFPSWWDQRNERIRGIRYIRCSPFLLPTCFFPRRSLRLKSPPSWCRWAFSGGGGLHTGTCCFSTRELTKTPQLSSIRFMKSYQEKTTLKSPAWGTGVYIPVSTCFIWIAGCRTTLHLR